jgi:hypothetical protein
MGQSLRNHLRSDDEIRELLTDKAARLVALDRPAGLFARRSFADKIEAVGLSPKTDLRYCNWSGVCFDGEDLRGFDFTGSDLSGCSFKDARLEGAVFCNVQLDRGALFEIANRGGIVDPDVTTQLRTPPRNLLDLLEGGWFGSDRGLETTERAFSMAISDLLRAANVSLRPEDHDVGHRVELARSANRGTEVAFVETAENELIVIDYSLSDMAYALDPASTSFLPGIAQSSNVLRRHVELVSSKKFRARLPANLRHFVVLLPSETALQAALRHDPNLHDDAWNSGTVLASPTALLTLLKLVLSEAEDSSDAKERGHHPPPARFTRISVCEDGSGIDVEDKP